MSGPRWIKLWISDMAALNERFRNDDGLVDFDALGREEYSFRVALITKKFGKSERAREIYRVAKNAYDSSVENGKKGGRPKKSPQDAPHGNAGEDLSTTGNRGALELPTSCDTLTADGDTREDSQDMHHARKGGTSESATSANLYALDGLAGKDRQPRAPGAHAKPRGARSPEIPDQEDLYGQVAAEGLDEFDARQWFDMCSDRRWLDRDGKPIANWKGALEEVLRRWRPQAREGERVMTVMKTARELAKGWRRAIASMAAGALLWGPFIAYAVLKG